MADLDLVRSLVAQENGLAVVATTRADGSVQASVANGGVLPHPLDGTAVVGVVAMGGSAKVRNLRKRPRASVVFRASWNWAAVEGPVELAGPDDPLEGIEGERLRVLLRDIFIAAGGTHDDFDEYDRVMATDRRVAVLVRPERISGNS
jgi:PPOX class probable F420-dependent enzyme